MSTANQIPTTLKNESDGNFRPTHVYKGQPCEVAQVDGDHHRVWVARSLEERASALAVSIDDVKPAPSAPLYLVEVRGANAIPAQIGRYSESIRAFTSGRLDWCPATVQPHDLPDSYTSAQRDAHPRADYWTPDGKSHRRVALFTSKRAAEIAVADGELYNGQQYRIRAARGEQLREGVVIDSYQAPHRPRRDPTAARVVKPIRVHPDTARRLDAEAKRSGISTGQVVDRLAESLPE
jgi:hypothetical protein